MPIVDRDAYLITLFKRLRQFARYSLGRITGTITDKEGKYLFLLDLAEAKRVQRVELNAIARILIDKKIVTVSEWSQVIEKEFKAELEAEQARWPEVQPAEDGGSYVLNTEGFAKRVKEESWPR